jgi:ABC-type uncharacterized transport system permease subunit
MILSAPPATFWAVLALAAYLAAAVPSGPERGWPARALLLAWLLHGAALWVAAGAFQTTEVAHAGWHIGFASVLSLTWWLVLLVHGVESRLLPVAGVRRALAGGGVLAVALAWLFPGELRVVAHSSWAPLHWVLGLTSYGLFGAAVLHALMLDATERKLRQHQTASAATFGLPLLRLERLTFRFVEAGFVVLTAALLLGVVSGHWRWDHKTVLSLLGWATFAHLVVGRLWRGWRGQRATRWIYTGALLLLLAYVGTRFVLEVLLHRSVA